MHKYLYLYDKVKTILIIGSVTSYFPHGNCTAPYCAPVVCGWWWLGHNKITNLRNFDIAQPKALPSRCPRISSARRMPWKGQMVSLKCINNYLKTSSNLTGKSWPAVLHALQCHACCRHTSVLQSRYAQFTQHQGYFWFTTAGDRDYLISKT